MKKPLPISIGKFRCENSKCKFEQEKQVLTENGILIGCLCPKCGWHMARPDRD